MCVLLIISEISNISKKPGAFLFRNVLPFTNNLIWSYPY